MKSPKKARFNFMPRSGDFCFRERGIFVDATVGYKKTMRARAASRLVQFPITALPFAES